MKKDFISAIAGWKSAALLALVAMVAAVAFSGVLSSTQTADAQATPATASAGSTVVVLFTDAAGTAETPDRFRISPDSDGSATFSNGAESITCYPDSPIGCDASTDGGVSLRVTIDDDSPNGSIFVQRVTRTDGSFSVATEHTITVVAANPPAAIRAFGAAPAAAMPATTAPGTTVTLADGTAGTVIGSQLVNARGDGIPGTTLLVTTTRGVLNSTHVTTPNNCISVSACTLTTQAAEEDDNDAETVEDPAGIVQVRLSGNGASGPAEVTFRELASGLARTVTVILHGPAASISAEVDQGTIGVGGTTFVVVTVLDADGNPAVGESDADFRSNKPLVNAIVGPDVPAGSSAVLLSYNREVNRDLSGVANDLPSCGAHTRDAVTADPNASPPVAAVAASSSAGTNTAGKCVIEVTAPAGGPGPADDATRGTHTLTVGTSNAQISTVNVEVEVGGAPSSIENDAPDRVDSLSSTSITVTVLDDEGVRVGAVPISVVQVEGSGNTDDFPGGDDATSSDGRGTFTFLAPLSEGEAVFLIRAGGPGQQIQSTITLAIGAEVEEADPEAPAATWSADLAPGTWNLVWNGEDGADPAAGAAEGVTAIWQWNGSSWDGYFPDAADVPGGNTLDSLSNGSAYWVVVE